MTSPVVVFGYENAQVLDITGPVEVFTVANGLAEDALYDVTVASWDGADIVGTSGMRIGADCAVADVNGAIDTLVVPGSWTVHSATANPALMSALAELTPRSRRVAAVCAGAFLLGAAGLLDGRRATTHWTLVDSLIERVPGADVARGPIFVNDGPIFTSAGATAGIDLALALVEADHGPKLAREVARFLIVFMQRPGGTEQFSVRLNAEPIRKFSLSGLLDEIAADPAGDHRLEALSERAGFSERHLTRVFAKELGVSPGRYVEQVRVEAARTMLETSDSSLDVIARESGLSSPETLRRRFTSEMGVTPHAYRQRFRTTGIQATGVASWSLTQSTAWSATSRQLSLAGSRCGPSNSTTSVIVSDL